MKRDLDIERQVVVSKIRDSKYNPRYKEIMSIEQSAYLQKFRKDMDIDIVARIRCGNMEEANKYWLEEEKNVASTVREI